MKLAHVEKVINLKRFVGKSTGLLAQMESTKNKMLTTHSSLL